MLVGASFALAERPLGGIVGVAEAVTAVAARVARLGQRARIGVWMHDHPRLRPPLFAVLVVATLTACPGDDPSQPDASSPDAPPDAAATATASRFGSISIQDQSIHRLPAAGHGLSVRIEFSETTRAPDFEEMPGQPTGCKVWLYDVAADPPPALVGDEGRVWIAGTSADVPHGCTHETNEYRCAAKSGAGTTTVTQLGGGAAAYTIAGAELGIADVGRRIRITGDTASPGNTGEHPILAVTSLTSAVVANPAATAGTFAATYTVYAGGGPAGMAFDSLHDPILDGDTVEVGIVAGGAMEFDIAPVPPIEAGGAFVLDTASDAVFGAIPIDGTPFSLGCSGPGGTCADAAVTILQLETTDGDITGLPPFVLPPPASKKVVLSCATLGASGRLDVPIEAAELLREANAAAPITRIRAAFMRDGFAFTASRPPSPPNQVRIVAGHQRVSFVDP